MQQPTEPLAEQLTNVDVIIEKVGENNNNEKESEKEMRREMEKLRRSVAFELSLEKHSCMASEIIDGFLFLGAGRDANDAEFIVQSGITHVLCMISGYKPRLVYTNYNINFLHLPIADSPAAKINVHFDQAIEFIASAKQENAKILVHCAAGISRSTSIVLAYLMKNHNMTLKDSYELVKSKRRIIRPNPGFFNQLVEYEKGIYGNSSLAFSDLANKFHSLSVPSLFTSSKIFASNEDGIKWAETVITNELLEKIFLDVCGGLYISEKTTDFLDRVLSEVKTLQPVLDMQREGYKWPKLSINLMKVASAWYRNKSTL